MVEIKNKLILYKDKLSSTKLAFSYINVLLFGIIDSTSENGNNPSNEENNQYYDPFIKLISKFEEIQKIIDLKEKDIYKFIYFNRNKVHNILYKNEQIIFVDCNRKIKNLSFYFYLSLLIREKEFINYTYSFDFIEVINNLQLNNKDKKYQRIIISKIIIQLIKNYKSNDDYVKIEEEKLTKIENDNNNIIE